MTTEKFIKYLMNQLFLNFDVKSLKYSYCEDSNTHMFIVDENIIKSKKFAEFDVKMTTEAWNENIEGVICFTQPDDLIEFYEFEEYINVHDNNALLSNINLLFSQNYFLEDSMKTIEPKYLQYISSDFSFDNHELAEAA